MDNQQLFHDIIHSYDNSDTQTFLELLSEDFEWHMVGDQVIRGKKGVKELFEQMEGNFRVISNEWTVKLLAGDTAVANGLTVVEEDGAVMKRLFCNIYEFSNGKLQKMSSYTIKREPDWHE